MPNRRSQLLDEINSLPAETLDSDRQLSELLTLLETADTKELLDRLTLGSILERILTQDLPPAARAELDLPEMRSFGLPPRGVEFLMGVLVCQDPAGTESVTYHELMEQFARVNDAYQLNLTALFAGHALDEKQYNLHRGLAHRELTTGRFHQPEQAIPAARRCYAPFDAEMAEAVDYTIEDAIQVVGFLLTALNTQIQQLLIRNLSSFRISDELKAAMEQDPGDSAGVYRMIENPRVQAGARFIDTVYEDWQDQVDAFWFNPTIAVSQLPDGLDPATFLEVIRSLRVKVGDPTGVPNIPFEEPFDGPNPIEVRPLLELDGRILPSTGAAVARALAETYYYRLFTHMSAAGQRDAFEARWGAILEEWTQDTLAPVFPVEDQIENPKYRTARGEQGETDIVIPYGRTLFVVECKSKKLPAETRSLDPVDVESHLEQGVGKAVQQTTKFIKALQQAGTLEVAASTGSVALDASDYDRYQPIIVLRDWYDNIATVDYTDILTDLSHTPYVVDIFSLEILLDILNSADAFNDYVTARRRELREHRYFSMDEIDYLGLYLAKGRSFPKPPGDHVWQIGNYTQFIERQLSPGFAPDIEDLLRP